MICGLEMMRWASTWEVRVGLVEATLSTNNRRIVELESQLALRNSELNATAAELESTGLCPRVAKEAVSLIGNRFKIKGGIFTR